MEAKTKIKTLKKDQLIKLAKDHIERSESLEKKLEDCLQTGVMRFPRTPEFHSLIVNQLVSVFQPSKRFVHDDNAGDSGKYQWAHKKDTLRRLFNFLMVTVHFDDVWTKELRKAAHLVNELAFDLEKIHTSAIQTDGYCEGQYVDAVNMVNRRFLFEDDFIALTKSVCNSCKVLLSVIPRIEHFCPEVEYNEFLFIFHSILHSLTLYIESEPPSNKKRKRIVK